MKRKTAIWIVVIVIAVALLYAFLLSVIVSRPGLGVASNRIGVIHIDGVISASGQGDSLGVSGTSPEDILSQLDEATKDSTIKAVLLRVNSPGGSAAASQEIFEAVKKMKKPVVVSVGDVCASGAYYLSSAANKILANPASSVGSIGVILEIPNLEQLFSKLGVKFTIIAKGKFKDMGNPARPLTAPEKKILSDQAEIVYLQFINDVAGARKIDFKEVKRLATGQTFTGTESIKLKLIDGIGNYNDALKEAAKLGKIPDQKFETVDLGQKNPFEVISKLFGGSSTLGVITPLADRFQKGYRF